MSLSANDFALFGFDSDGWLERARTAHVPETRGRLGSYDLIEEVGRGGQGIVYRARHTVSGAELALKRLLAGAFAPPDARLRFERELEAAAALDHPGIVKVHGLERVDGTPVLAMEWIDGLEITRWARASGRTRAEILGCFLLLCDAVQHAHQRGVLHRDLKPSNVLVDAAGRPHVLDLGLAKLAAGRGAAISSTGGFLGTPSYAAPEQWRGEALDVRADVYALGAILFEMLAGRRLFTGDVAAALAQTAQPAAVPRPSQFERAIPRDLDAIVCQAVAPDPAERYQSVDAFSADLRRLLRGEPVLARAAGTAYLLRKLVARNRVATALLALLVVASVAYFATARRNARLLALERDRALAAAANEQVARRAADEQRARAEEEQRQADALRAEAESARESIRIERDRAEALLGFLSDDVLGAVDPALLGRDPKLVDILLSAAGKAKERFAKAPEAEAAMHCMLGHALAALGHFEPAEREFRTGLAARPDADDLSRARDDLGLGKVLVKLGRYAVAEEFLLDLAAKYEARSSEAEVREHLSRVLNEIGHIKSLTGRGEEALELAKRALALTADEDEARTLRSNMAIALGGMGRLEEAIALQEADLAERIAAGADAVDVAMAHYNLGLSLEERQDLAAAEVHHRRALELQQSVYGERHPALVLTLGNLAITLVGQEKDYAEAEELARRAHSIGEEHASAGHLIGASSYHLAFVLECRRKFAEAIGLYRRALALADEVQNTSSSWTVAAQGLVRALIRNRQTEGVEELMERLSAAPSPPPPAWFFLWKGNAIVVDGDLVAAALWFEDGIGKLSASGKDRLYLRSSLSVYAAILRKLDATDEALELERRLAELGGAPTPLEDLAEGREGAATPR